MTRWLAVVVLVALAVGTPAEAQSRRPAAVPRIAFADDYKLRVVTADGRRDWTVALTGHDVPILGWHVMSDPAWSPDGSHVAYGESQGALSSVLDTELGVARADGTEDRTILSLPSAGIIHNVRWSPDGKRLAFLLWTPNPATTLTWIPVGLRWEAYLINVDGSGLRPVAPAHGMSVHSLEFSPDGKHLAFVSDHEGVQGVHTVAVDGPPVPRRVTPVEMTARDVRWSPDGRQLAFTGQRVVPVDVTGWDRLWIVGADGSNLRELPVQTYQPPSWSPDGRSLAYVCADKCGIATIRADGSRQRALTPNFGNEYWPVWSRHGIAFVREIGSACCIRSLWVMNENGSNQRRLTEARSVDYSPAWSG